MDRDLVEARPSHALSDSPRVRKIINDNYCVGCVAGKSVCVHVTGKVSCSVNCLTRQKRLCLCNRKEGQFSYRDGRKEGLFVSDRQERDSKYFDCKFLSCFNSCSFCKWVSAKERCESQLLSSSRNKACEQCFLCRSPEFCKICHKCPNCCSRSACRGQITPVLEKMGSPRSQPQSLAVLREGYTLPFQFWPNLTR